MKAKYLLSLIFLITTQTLGESMVEKINALPKSAFFETVRLPSADRLKKRLSQLKGLEEFIEQTQILAAFGSNHWSPFRVASIVEESFLEYNAWLASQAKPLLPIERQS